MAAAHPRHERCKYFGVLTQFGYACKTLGVDLKTTSVSQAKGMVERANQTVQSRLKPELRLASVKTIEEANKYLTEQFIPNFNKKFGNKTRKGWSIFKIAPSERKINYTFAVFSSRVFDRKQLFLLRTSSIKL